MSLWVMQCIMQCITNACYLHRVTLHTNQPPNHLRKFNQPISETRNSLVVVRLMDHRVRREGVTSGPPTLGLGVSSNTLAPSMTMMEAKQKFARVGFDGTQSMALCDHLISKVVPLSWRHSDTNTEQCLIFIMRNSLT